MTRFKTATFLLRESQTNLVCFCHESLLSIDSPRYLYNALYTIELLPYLKHGRGPTKVWCEIITASYLDSWGTSLLEKHMVQNKKKLHLFWTIPTPISTTKDVICCSNGYPWLYKVAAFCQCQFHIMSKNVEHSSEKTPRELMERFTEFHTSATHFFDQVQIFFFFTYCILIILL